MHSATTPVSSVFFMVLTPLSVRRRPTGRVPATLGASAGDESRHPPGRDSPPRGGRTLSAMEHSLPIGDFARATHLSVKTLRYYHRVGLLEPADVDPHTGYRRYTTAQIPTAQIIRRFRDLDMPLDQIHAVLEAPDLRTRNELISAHLASLEQRLARTQSAVASLRDLLAHPAAVAPVSHR